MRAIANYFSESHQKKFSEALPRLREFVGATPFTHHNQTYGATGNTLRAYRALRVPPSVVFRKWAWEICNRPLLTVFTLELEQHVSSRGEFTRWHESLARKLQNFWRAEQKQSLSYAQQFKLVDLFIKWLSEHDFNNEAVKAGLIEHANCALDRQILLRLNDCLRGALPMPSPSMGHIKNKFTYTFCQELIDEFSRACGGTPLLFDYWAWRRGG